MSADVRSSRSGGCWRTAGWRKIDHCSKTPNVSKNALPFAVEAAGQPIDAGNDQHLTQVDKAEDCLELGSALQTDPALLFGAQAHI